MKSLFIVAVLIVLAGCTSSNEFGKCIGIGDERKPNLEYKISGWNVAMGIIFFEVIIPPILVLTDETFCPVGKK